MPKSSRNFAAVTRVGLAQAKSAFQVHLVDAKGDVVAARRLARGRLVGFCLDFRVVWRRWRPVRRLTSGRGWRRGRRTGAGRASARAFSGRSDARVSVAPLLERSAGRFADLIETARSPEALSALRAA